MGHSSIAVTYDLYGHLMPGSEDEARDLVDAYLERANTTARLPVLEDAWVLRERAKRGQERRPYRRDVRRRATGQRDARPTTVRPRPRARHGPCPPREGRPGAHRCDRLNRAGIRRDRARRRGPRPRTPRVDGARETPASRCSLRGLSIGLWRLGAAGQLQEGSGEASGTRGPPEPCGVIRVREEGGRSRGLLRRGVSGARSRSGVATARGAGAFDGAAGRRDGRGAVAGRGARRRESGARRRARAAPTVSTPTAAGWALSRGAPSLRPLRETAAGRADTSTQKPARSAAGSSCQGRGESARDRRGRARRDR